MTSVPTQGVHIPGDMSGSMVPRLQLKEIDSYTAKLPASTEHETETVPLDLDDIVGINGGLKENHVIVDSTPTFGMSMIQATESRTQLQLQNCPFPLVLLNAYIQPNPSKFLFYSFIGNGDGYSDSTWTSG